MPSLLQTPPSTRSPTPTSSPRSHSPVSNHDSTTTRPVARLFIKNLAWATTDDSLRNAFAPFGTIEEATVVYDKDTGRPRGFGFVTFETEEAATAAIQQMHRADLDGRPIQVDRASRTGPQQPQADKSSQRRLAGGRSSSAQTQASL